ncbi:hypothetical protein Hdeb2414_s0009g00316751 [Helianthus debilis subsp. tardiflorus]
MSSHLSLSSVYDLTPATGANPAVIPFAGNHTTFTHPIISLTFRQFITVAHFQAQETERSGRLRRRRRPSPATATE